MKTNYLIHLFIILGIAFLLVSCEDVIDIKLDKGTSQLAVDALIIVNDGPQTVRLTKTTPYFENGVSAPGVSGAQVGIRTSGGQIYIFTEDPNKPGNYVSAVPIIGSTNEIFTLGVFHEGQTFVAASFLVRGTVIDSVYQNNRPEQFGNKAGSFIELIANDSAGIGDFCWLRYSLNGKADLRYNRLGAAFPADAAFSPGNADGLQFIWPIRNSINPDDGYLLGDTIAMELLSIDPEQWRFLKEMDTQLNNTGLFASPLANVRGNVFNLDSTSKILAVGCFGMARVSRAGLRIK